jgi:hypothetical protein
MAWNWNSFGEKIPKLDRYIYMTDSQYIWIHKPLYMEGVIIGINGYVERGLKWSYVYMPDLPSAEIDEEKEILEYILKDILDRLDKLERHFEK